MSSLLAKTSRPLPEGSPALAKPEVERLLKEVPGYSVDTEGRRISRSYKFEDYYATLAFVNALAWIVHREDHHPDLEVSFDTCRVTFWTHTVNGLSENDFICAAKINALIRSL